jgi:hypothetical protein
MIFAPELLMHALQPLEGGDVREVNLPGGFFVMGPYELCIGIGLRPSATVVAQAVTMNALTVALETEVPTS